MTRAQSSRVALPTAVLVALTAAWEVLGRARAASGTPLPSEVLVSLFREPGFYAHHAALTGAVAVGGLSIAVALGLVAAAGFSVWSRFRQALFPIVVLSQTVPLIAIAPLLASLIGDGAASRVLVTSWLCWFPVVVGATHGLMNVDSRLLALFEGLGADRGDIFWKLRAPSAAPSIVASVRAAAGFALIGAIVSEYSGTREGLGGFLMAEVIRPTNAVHVFGVMLVASIGGLALTEGAHGLARRALRRYLPRP